MLTPRDIENVEFKKVALGFSPDEVNDFLDKVIVDFEMLMKENARLTDRVGVLEEGVKYYKNMEETLKDSLMLAEKTAVETKNNANILAEQIVKEAHLKGNEIVQDAQGKLYELDCETNRLRGQYNAMKAKMRIMLEASLEILNSTKLEDDTARKEEQTEE